MRVVLVVLRGIKVSRKLHNDMFNKIIRAPVNHFFDRVPLGRLINRFASDLDLVDSSLPFTLGGLLYYPVNLLSKFVMCYIAGTAWPQSFLSFYFPAHVICSLYSRIYQSYDSSLLSYIYSNSIMIRFPIAFVNKSLRFSRSSGVYC